jgi:hypothetical protein
MIAPETLDSLYAKYTELAHGRWSEDDEALEDYLLAAGKVCAADPSLMLPLYAHRPIVDVQAVIAVLEKDRYEAWQALRRDTMASSGGSHRRLLSMVRKEGAGFHYSDRKKGGWLRDAMRAQVRGWLLWAAVGEGHFYGVDLYQQLTPLRPSLPKPYRSTVEALKNFHDTYLCDAYRLGWVHQEWLT